MTAAQMYEGLSEELSESNSSERYYRLWCRSQQEESALSEKEIDKLSAEDTSALVTQINLLTLNAPLEYRKWFDSLLSGRPPDVQWPGHLLRHDELVISTEACWGGHLGAICANAPSEFIDRLHAQGVLDGLKVYRLKDGISFVAPRARVNKPRAGVNKPRARASKTRPRFYIHDFGRGRGRSRGRAHSHTRTRARSRTHAHRRARTQSEIRNA
jgi:hypothetical protein